MGVGGKTELFINDDVINNWKKSSGLIVPQTLVAPDSATPFSN